MNYSKINGQLVCKMAMPLAFMFAACSDTNSGSDVAGGTVEETGIYALSGRVGEVYPKLLDYVKNVDPQSGSLSFGNEVLAKEGTIVSVYELDASTFAETGTAFVDTVNNGGRFAFDSLFLNSPYALITTQERVGDKYKEARKAIVDLRKKKEISVNLLTSAKVPYVQDYLAEGKTFEEANQLAERATLAKYGVYEDLGPFENLNDGVTELSYVAKLMTILEHLGPLVSGRSTYDAVMMIGARVIYSTPDEDINLDSELGQFYLSDKKMASYVVEYFASQNGFGQCTESRENEMHVVTNYMGPYGVVCRSGKWVLGFKKIDYTAGSMTDDRKGKTYKTVTYNWGDVSQTWMAEDYLDDSQWGDAMAVEDDASSLNFANHQGVCPDGWRIPNLDDWHVLLENMGSQYGVAYDKVVPALYDGPATGFGLHSRVMRRDVEWAIQDYEPDDDEMAMYYANAIVGDFWVNFIVANASIPSIQLFTHGDILYGFDFSMDQEDQHRLDVGFTGTVRGAGYGHVRCIKN